MYSFIIFPNCLQKENISIPPDLVLNLSSDLHQLSARLLQSLIQILSFSLWVALYSLTFTLC